MIEITENLHREDLTAQERADQTAEWIRITDLKLAQVALVSGQLAHKPQGGRPEAGIAAASRELGIERTEARRAVKIASIAPEAKLEAVSAGIEDNQSAPNLRRPCRRRCAHQGVALSDGGEFPSPKDKGHHKVAAALGVDRKEVREAVALGDLTEYARGIAV